MSDCPHANTHIELTPRGPHHGKIICESCKRFLGWAKKPRDLHHELHGGTILHCPECSETTLVSIIGASGAPQIVCGDCGAFAGYMPVSTSEKYIQANRGLI